MAIVQNSNDMSHARRQAQLSFLSYTEAKYLGSLSLIIFGNNNGSFPSGGNERNLSNLFITLFLCEASFQEHGNIWEWTQSTCSTCWIPTPVELAGFREKESVIPASRDFDDARAGLFWVEESGLWYGNVFFVAYAELARSVRPDGTSVPAGMENFTVGLIGMGDMGRMYAEGLSEAGWRILACDREDRYDSLKEKYNGKKNIEILPNGHYVSRASDYIIYSVEAAIIDRVIAQYGPSTKMGAIVGGQTSCKSPEIEAFEAYLPSDVYIVSVHSLHGPGVDPHNQPLVLIQHRAPDEALRKVETVLSCLKSKYVHLTAQEHDRITADTQAVTHAAFLSMGKAWHANTQYPWELSRYVGGIENVKMNIMLRIYSQKWHVYAGLAILNPEARKQVAQYAKSVTELYKLMLEGNLEGLKARIYGARDRVFGPSKTWASRPLLEPSILTAFSLGTPSPEEPARPNNHLSLLAMVDCWAALGIVPYDHMLCSTPLFRLRLGVTEHLFRNTDMLDEALQTAVDDKRYRSDDLEFTFAARGWAECVTLGHFETWEKRFVSTQEFFQPRFADAKKVGDEMMKKVQASMEEALKLEDK
ncbi:hypothetical protein TrVFT333_006894 [Trichoderma virens FT-333]|nr:hypothetical protein TrVFT333_006894 [Trichoderma virens FT-333]